MLVAVVVVTVISLVVYSASESRRQSDLRADAAERARSAAAAYSRGDSLPRDARIVSGGPPMTGTPGTPGPSEAGRGQGVRAEATVEEPSGGTTTIEVFASGRTDRRALADLRRTLLVSSSFIVVLSGLVGYAAATALSRRLHRAAAVARRIAEGDLAARTHLRGRDEVAQLGRVVDDMAAKVAERIERERRFSADVAHELRTPVTGLVTASHLLPDDDVSAMVKRQSRALSRLVEDLLEVSRLDSGAERAQVEDVDVAALCATLVREREVDAEVIGAAHVRTDPRRLRRVVANLVDNAQVHGCGPVLLEVSVSGIAVVDHGDGFVGDLLSTATDRFVTSGRGTGLGLSIAIGQAEVLGAQLVVGNDPVTGGGRVELRWGEESLANTCHENASNS
ncbi:sensor histidine kinase [Aeromicrobium erythreum]|uniref:sensor histidine kinase n=1 Tax=Aeromicrobium erythreum TaxID=2041 RepID=UPI00130E56EC|nr:HAMP domain-containing sensor histidine kinase [Aeromicrobium erythreum]